MFFCEPCRKARDWPAPLRRSHGRCELCDELTTCYDVPASFLPAPKMAARRISRVPARLPERLPDPECQYGYTVAQVEEIMGDRIGEFRRWMFGQTIADCQARAGCDTPHGFVTYRSDVMQFLEGGQPLD